MSAPFNNSSEIQPTLEAELAVLRKLIENAYVEPVLIADAERYAARFLAAQMMIADELSKADLNARMHKNGVKAVRAKVFLDAVNAVEKKPSDSMLEQIVNSHDLVKAEHESYDAADVRREYLSNYFGIMKDGHLFYRGIAKGRYE